MLTRNSANFKIPMKMKSHNEDVVFDLRLLRYKFGEIITSGS